MSIDGIRFRTDGSLVVLQVLEVTPRKSSHYLAEDTAEWRDAKVEDLLDASKFTETNFARRLDQLANRLGSVEQWQSMRDVA